MRKFRYRPLLAETFCDVERSAGTCYRAAGWIPLGMTRGFTRTNRQACDFYVPNDRPKTLWVKPLAPDALHCLRDTRRPPAPRSRSRRTPSPSRRPRRKAVARPIHPPSGSSSRSRTECRPHAEVRRDDLDLISLQKQLLRSGRSECVQPSHHRAKPNR